ncbi:phosphoribosyltransferase [Muricoccus vinaceus]|uniref:Phosphoribosyltransferase n=1 Tax=Muricoccus vinaceus TaxID=424704 RepID=A0ABV6IVX0_9PROT
MMFLDRADAGRQLAQSLLHLKVQDPVVLALPRGGVPVGYEVAEALGAPLDLLLVRKIGTPGQAELAVGAVVDGARPEMVINEDIVRQLGVPASYLEQEAARQLAEIERRRAAYLRGRPPVALEGRTAIMVDDGIATGATARASLRALAASGTARRVVLAVPVAPAEIVKALSALCDEAITLSTPEDFRAVGLHYGDFRQTEDAEVIELLDRAAVRTTAAGSGR